MAREQSVPKTLFDWEGVRVGDVVSTVADPGSGGMRSLVVRLSPEARATLGEPSFTLSVPARYVFSLRRDAVVLDRALREMSERRARLDWPPA